MKSLVLTLAVALLAAAPASAQERRQARQPTQYSGEDRVVLDPTKAYIFYRTQYRTNYRFMREPDAAEVADHAARRAAALAQARERYARRLRQWESQRRLCRGQHPSRCQAPMDRPTEPTEATFAFDPPELDNFVFNQIRPRIWGDGDQVSGWLIAVQPGTYVLYGAIAQGQGAMAGGCFCMGSVRFDAPAGKITHFGTISDDISQEDALAFAREHGERGFRLGHGVVTPAAADNRPLPPTLASLPVVPAQLRAADKMPNYFGVFIARIAPIPGILAYRRDVVVDGRTGQPVEAAATAPAAAGAP